jgi:hypothetical protein
MTVKPDLEAKEQQRRASKRATNEQLFGKKRAQKHVKVYINEEEVEMTFRAFGHMEYDKLQSKFPPNIDQRAKGESFDIDRFGPALMSKVVYEPELSAEEWAEIWKSPDWSRGECAQLFAEAVSICTRGLDIPFTESD